MYPSSDQLVLFDMTRGTMYRGLLACSEYFEIYVWHIGMSEARHVFKLSLGLDVDSHMCLS